MPEILGIGTDITECLRIARMIERHGEFFLGRVFTPDEIRYCQCRKQATQHFAGRWAAKEAVLRALGTGWGPGIQWHDIEVVAEAGSPPAIALRGRVKEIARQQGVVQVLLSISHCRTYATATAIAVGRAV